MRTLKIVLGIFCSLVLVFIAIAFWVGTHPSNKLQCSNIAVEWIVAFQENKYPGKFTLGPNQAKLLEAIPLDPGNSFLTNAIIGAKAGTPLQNYLPNFLRVCTDFYKFAASCPKIQEGAVRRKRDPEFLGVAIFRKALSEMVLEHLGPFDFEEIAVLQVESFLNAKYPDWCK